MEDKTYTALYIHTYIKLQGIYYVCTYERRVMSFAIPNDKRHAIYPQPQTKFSTRDRSTAADRWSRLFDRAG